jgi:hypothetical protein
MISSLKIFFLLILSVCVVQKTLGQHNRTHRVAENTVLAKVRALPEVIDYLKDQKRLNPDLIIEDTPDSANEYYSVTVGLNTKNHFFTYWRFYVNSKTLEIYFWDINDEGSGRITLKQWRRWRNNPGFDDLHSYKAGKLIVSK